MSDIFDAKSETGHDLPGFRTPDGKVRLLAALPNRGLYKYTPYSASNPVIPRSEWKSFARVRKDVPILDQGQVGCHDDATEVLTDKGWKLWSALDHSELLGTMNPLTHRLEFQAPTAFHAYDYDGPLYHSTNRRIDFALTPNHRMYVRKWDEKARTLSPDFGMVEAQGLGWYAGLPSSTSGYCGIQMERVSVEADGREMIGNDFVALIALVLSDGWAGGTEDNKNLVSFCCFRGDRYEMVASLAHRVGFKEQPSRKGVWFKTDGSLADWIRSNCYSRLPHRAPNKLVPDIIKRLSKAQVEHFLAFFGDQNASENRRHFYSSSTRMIDDLQELLLRIGRRGTVMERAPRSAKMKDGREIHAENCSNEFTLIECQGDKLSLERKKSVETDRYKGTVFCATVPNSTLVTRRNKSILISGNSCNAHGFASSLMRARSIAGQQFQLLSASFLYALINGGRDQGSVPEDAANALINTGICLDSEVPEGFYTQSNIARKFPGAAVTAKRFTLQAEGIYQISSWDELVSAVILDYTVPTTVYVAGNWNDFDKNGCPPFRRGQGNHVVCDDNSLIMTTGGDAMVPARNSWNTTWGNNGRFNYSEAAVDNQPGFVAYAIKWANQDPQDPNLVPSAN